MTGKHIKTGFAASLMASFALALPAPMPRITVESPNALYALAYWKVAVGESEAAAKLVAEAARKSQAARQPSPAHHSVVSSRICPKTTKG